VRGEKKELKNEKVYRALRNMIALHRFEQGFSLNVQKLSKELGVSRTPVWEAMRKLEQQGVIETIPNRGVFITIVSFEQMLEVIGVRGVMDAFAGRLACERINKRMIDRLAQCLPDQLRAIETGDVAAYLLADNKFHGLIYEASGNSYLMELYESITLRMLPVPVSTDILIRPPHQPSVYLAHQQVVEGLANRDVAQVEGAMARHTKIIVTYLKEKKRAEAERKEMVRRLEKQLPPSPRLKRRRPRSPAKNGMGDHTE
jgi:DNA-binding GntR family transcriptional regulator